MSEEIKHKVVDAVTTFMYILASTALLRISILLIGFSLWEVGYAIYNRQSYIDASVDAIGLIVISMAVFDIANYLYDEQIVRNL
jgi:hypothetical protein